MMEVRKLVVATQPEPSDTIKTETVETAKETEPVKAVPIEAGAEPGQDDGDGVQVVPDDADLTDAMDVVKYEGTPASSQQPSVSLSEQSVEVKQETNDQKATTAVAKMYSDLMGEDALTVSCTIIGLLAPSYVVSNSLYSFIGNAYCQRGKRQRRQGRLYSQEEDSLIESRTISLRIFREDYRSYFARAGHRSCPA